MKVFFIALVVFLLVFSMAACANDEPADAPEAIPEDTPAVVEEDTPAPPPEPEPSSDWKTIDIFGLLSIEINKDWIVSDEGDRIKYYLDGKPEYPNLTVSYDNVSGFDGDSDEGFEAFFEWWLRERFDPFGLEVSRQEFVEYNGVRALEIVFFDVDDNGDSISRHSLYTIVGTTYIALAFRFEPGGDSSYLEDIAKVFGSIQKNNDALSGWPDAYLPPGTPRYPGGGDLEINLAVEEAVGMTIYNTSESFLMEYIDLLKNAGWNVEGAVSGFSTQATKDTWFFVGAMQDETTATLNFGLR